MQHSLPEQFMHTFKSGQFVTTPVTHSAGWSFLHFLFFLYFVPSLIWLQIVRPSFSLQLREILIFSTSYSGCSEAGVCVSGVFVFLFGLFPFSLWQACNCFLIGWFFFFLSWIGWFLTCLLDLKPLLFVCLFSLTPFSFIVSNPVCCSQSISLWQVGYNTCKFCLVKGCF